MRKVKLLIFIALLCLLKIGVAKAENIYKEYKIGDKITYNGMDFYVIEASDANKDYVTMLKADPLSVDEINKYGIDLNGVNHVNSYTKNYVGTASDWNGYGGMAYYTSKTCGYNSSGNYLTDGCTNEYDLSDVKYVVDAWAEANFSEEVLKEDTSGYSARLITYEELTNNLGYAKSEDLTFAGTNGFTPYWVSSGNYNYWAMSKYDNNNFEVRCINGAGHLLYSSVTGYDEYMQVVRPVINFRKEFIPIVSKKKLTDKEFKIGDVVEYNDMEFYVIEASDENSDRVTMLKAEPLTVDEVNTYGGVGTDNNHVNMYKESTSSIYRTSEDISGYGGMVYYSSKTCGWNGSSWVYDGCKTDYEKSEVKYVVDVWALDKFLKEDLIEDASGYSTRLLTIEELINNLGYTKQESSWRDYYVITEKTPSWVHNRNYGYYTMSLCEDSISDIWSVSLDGYTESTSMRDVSAIRPVVTLKKITEDKSENIEIEKEENDDIKNESTEDKKTNQIISIPDTLLKKPILFAVIGVILTVTSITIYILIRGKDLRRKRFKKVTNEEE